ncbi:MAG: peptidoglycan editing factor PgeF [Acidobacteriaceae bacterium]
MKAKKTDALAADGLGEIDVLFATGGLARSPRKSRSPAVDTQVPNLQQRGPAGISPTRTVDVIRVPQWKQYPWLIHGFSTRTDGVSTAYVLNGGSGELNLGFTSADLPENVEINRKIFLGALLGHRPSGKTPQASMRLEFLRQIHSGLIHHLDGSSVSANSPSLQGDGWIASAPGLLAAIQTADCLPILVADVRQRIVAAFHAGWRGTLARIAERGVGRMRAEFGSRAENLTASIGPGIGGCCYSVGEEVRLAFGSQFSYADALFHEVFDMDPIKKKYPMLFLTARAPGHSDLGPSTHLDLAEANRRQLMDAGISHSQIHHVGSCTACNVDRFFSHRADHGFTGRMLGAIGTRAVP